MRYCQMFGKTSKQSPKDSQIISHQLLYRAGYIRESTAGRYFMLPLGQKVQQKIMAIIKEEMDKIGAQEVLSPVLHPLELWQETNRTQTTGFELMKVKDRHKAEFALGGTAEEMFVDLVRKFQLSYKDLPFNIYQFSLKFRDELRARGGLLRVREFLMKDAYSFDVNETVFKNTYRQMWHTYEQIFNRLGLKTVVVEADNGYIGGDYCHEFVVEAKNGESKFFTTNDGQEHIHEDIIDQKNLNKSRLTSKVGIEVGNIFQLGYHYTKLMKGATFVDKDGQEKPLYMGCYGIGLGRSLAAIVETHYDQKGIIWPESVAPFQVHLIGLNLEQESVRKQADAIYQTLTKQGIEVLYDDRLDVNAGTKFADADLIGIPYRLVISAKTGKQVELKKRSQTESKLIDPEKLYKELS